MTTSIDLISALHALPHPWALTPVNQKKAYIGGWQQTGLSREAIEQEISSHKADGFGILTGELSGGLIAIDCDGYEPHLFSVPQEHWANISTKKEGDANNGGQLEWRWSGCYSVLPPSAHPETDGYHWVKSPDECLIAPLPEKALEHLLNLCKPKAKAQAKPTPKTAGNITPIPLERCLSKKTVIRWFRK